MRIELPKLNIGDSWTMQSSDSKEILLMKVVDETIYRGQEAYKIRSKGSSNAIIYLSKARMDIIGMESEKNGKTNKTTIRYEYTSGRQWPMKVGKHWQVKRFTNTGKGEKLSVDNFSVVANVSLNVSAGVFNCLKVVTRQTNTKQDFDFVGTLWWCPEIKYLGKFQADTIWHSKKKSRHKKKDSHCRWS